MRRKRLAGSLLASGILFIIALYLLLAFRHTQTQVLPGVTPPGKAKDTLTHLLELGAKVLQDKAPLQGTYVYFVGFHPMKEHPEHQMEAHHYCKQMNEEFAQCMLFDSNTEKANLTGLEYIISEKLYNELPNEEKNYWHPHNYEILSGQLVAPDLPTFAELPLLKKKMNSYGKTFHTWRAKCWEGEKPFKDVLPQGEAILAWSFNDDQEAKETLVNERDERMDIDTRKKRQERHVLAPLANPPKGIEYDKE